MKIDRFRDLTLVSINEKQLMVIACDSCGGIGNKKMDVLKTNPDIVGYYTTRVPLMEVLSIGAEPITVINTLSVEMDDTGVQIIKGIKKVLEPLDLPEDIIVNGSTEENFPVCQTGIGVTIVGIVNKEEWTKPKTETGYILAVVGLPKVGQEVLEDNERTILSPSIIIELRENVNIGEIVPVGSKGILHEVQEIAKTNHLLYKINDDMLVDLSKSAGPSTCGVFTLREDEYDKLKKYSPIPVNKVGQFIDE